MVMSSTALTLFPPTTLGVCYYVGCRPSVPSLFFGGGIESARQAREELYAAAAATATYLKCVYICRMAYTTLATRVNEPSFYSQKT